MSKLKHYCLFGYSLNDEDEVGYLGQNLKIVQDIHQAKLFPSKNNKKAKGFASPAKWLKFINEDEDLSHGFKFHLVATSLMPKES